MSDNTEAKIEQIRNDVAKKLNKWDKIQVGYTGEPEPERKEGDSWLDGNGKRWIVRNGIRQSVSKLQTARVPAFCPTCQHTMTHRFDTKFYNLYNECYECTIKAHTKMMANGTWEAFEKKTMRDNEKAYLTDKIAEYKDYMRTFKVPQMHYSDGRWDQLATLEHFTGMFEEIKVDIKLCEDRLQQIQEDELNDNNK